MKKYNIAAYQGQTLVEFAILIPLLLLLFVMIFDLGRAVYYSSAIHNAAREGARWGVVHYNTDIKGNTLADESGMIAATKKFAIGLGLSGTNVNISAGWGADEPNGNHTVRVTMTYTFTPATPLLSNFLSGGVIHLTGDAVMRTEYDIIKNK
jgi:Flp pilus assembly protein TadG